MPDQPQGYGWSPEVQRKVVMLPVLDADAWGQLGKDVLRAEHVTHPALQHVARVVFGACGDAAGPVSIELLDDLVKERLAQLRPTIADAVAREWALCRTERLPDAAVLRQKAGEWARTQALVAASNKTVDLIERGGALDGENGGEILRMFQDALAVGRNSRTVLRMVGDSKALIALLSSDPYKTPTGFRAIDEATGGGLEVGLHVLAGAAKRGKTSFLTQMSVAAARRGETVWQVSGEVLLYSLAKRTVVSMTGRTRQQVLDKPVEAVRALDGYRFAGGEILLEYQPLFSPDWMATGLRQLESQGHRVDLIVADYIDLMSTGGRRPDERRWELSTIAKELRRLSTEVGVPIMTAKSVTASSVDKAYLTMQDLAECKEIAYIVDNLFAICSVKEERQRKPQIVRLQHMLGRDTDDLRMLTAYERDNERQRWVELPTYLRDIAERDAAK